jgi:hypothetical protein
VSNGTETMKAQQADQMIGLAIAAYTEASGIYNQMSQMSTWTPEYDHLNCRALALVNEAKSFQARYDAWKTQREITARRDAILAEWEQDAADLREADKIDRADRADDPMKMETPGA